MNQVWEQDREGANSLSWRDQRRPREEVVFELDLQNWVSFCQVEKEKKDILERSYNMSKWCIYVKALLYVWKWMSSLGVLMYGVHVMGHQEMHPEGLENA